MDNQHYDDEGESPRSLTTLDIGLGGATFLAFGAVDLVANLGLTGFVVGGIAALVAARHGADIVEMVRDAIPSPSRYAALPEPENKEPKSERSFWDRALGRFPEPPLLNAPLPDEEEEQDDDEEIIDLADEPKTYEYGYDADGLIEVEEDRDIFPYYPPDKQLRMGQVISTKKRFDPPINDLLGKGMIIAGSQGAGKSNLTGLCATGAGKCYMSVVVFDLKREFYTLIETVPNGIRAGHPSFAHEAGGGYYPLTADTAPEFASLIMENGFQAIIDIPSYNGNNDEVALVIATTLNALMDWSQGQPEEDRLPCLVVTDEAHNFLPERPHLSAMRMRSDSFDTLQSAYSRMINTGRSYGYTMLMATQRIANIAKWAIANLQVKVIMRHAEKNDLDRCEDEVGKEVADRNLVKRLEQGTGIVVGLTPEPVIVHFDKQPARHVSHTPSIERSHQRFRNRQQRQAPVYQPMMRQVRPIAPIPLYRNTGKIAPDMPDIPMKTMPLPKDKDREAIEVWERLVEESEANVRNFAAKMSIPDSKAYTILDRLQRAGLIRWERRRKA